jgi:hypothetical protein
MVLFKVGIFKRIPEIFMVLSLSVCRLCDNLTSVVNIENQDVHRIHHKRLNFSSWPNSPYYYSCSQKLLSHLSLFSYSFVYCWTCSCPVILSTVLDVKNQSNSTEMFFELDKNYILNNSFVYIFNLHEQFINTYICYIISGYM